MIKLQPQSQLTVPSGTYFVDHLDIEPNAKIRTSTAAGPVVIYVSTSLIFRGSVTDSNDAAPQFLLIYTGASPIYIESSFTGALVAPNSSVHLQAARPAGHTAFIYGNQLTAEPDTILHGSQFDWTRFTKA